MSEEEDSMLGANGPLEMNVVSLPKMDTAQLEQLGLNEHTSTLNANNITSLVSSPQQYIGTSSAGTQGLLDGVVTQGSRSALSSVGGNSAVTFTSTGSNSQDSYTISEYVTHMPLQDDQQSKFPDALVAVDNVAFVEMNDATMKNVNVSAPIELYFDVINPPTTSAVTTANVHHVRHEHQTPKAQILERAYSDFMQEHQQQMAQQQQQIAEQDHSTHVLPDVATSLVQLDHDVLPPAPSIHEFRKPPKLDHQKRQMHLLQQQRQLQQQQQHQQQQLSRQLQQQQDQGQVTHHLRLHQQQQQQHPQHPQQQQQHPQQQQHQQKSIQQYHHPQERQIQQQPAAHQQRHIQDQFENHLTRKVDNQNSGTKVMDLQQQLSPHVAQVSRSGRLIRRKQEYLEYVAQNIKDELIVPQLSQHIVKSEEFTGPTAEEDEPAEEVIDDDDHLEEELDSNDDDGDDSSNYTIDGKKSLPHKKRIPRKLKTNKRQVKCYKCTYCEEQFTNQQQFNTHKQMHISSLNKPKPFNCEICKKGFDSQLKFFEHLKFHYEPNKKHKCEVCSGEFENSAALQEHSLVHSREHFKCEICNKTFRKESMLEVHVKVAHVEEGDNNAAEKVYTCSACPKSFHNQVALDSHVQTEHTENPPEFNCEDCYQAFKTKAKLTSHRKIEHKETGTQKPAKKKGKVSKAAKGAGYQCTYCPRVFAHKNSLVYHVRGHTGERPHQCEQCGKAFFAASALKVHLRLHSGEKPYECPHCGKFFRQWGDLRYHTTSVHSDARQFQCEYCGKDFKRKYCLVVHRRIHTGEKNYKCEHCGKAFRAASYLQNHRRIHTGVRPHPCPDCGKPFRVRSDMKRHRQTHQRDGSSHSTNHAANNQPHTQAQAQAQTQSPAAHTPGEPQLIIADQLPGSNDHSIRIMVSGINPQVAAAAVHPPPAHRQSQNSTPNSIATIASSPVSPALTPEVIIMDETTNQPINLNVIPRIVTQDSVSSPTQANHIHVTAIDDEVQVPYQLGGHPGRSALEVRSEDGNSVYVWHGVFTT